MRAARRFLTLAAGAALAPWTGQGALAAQVQLDVTFPQIDAVPYYRPYLVAWLETPAGPQRTVATWYDTRLRDDIGTGFLKNLRHWWRATGKDLDLPIDAIAGPTRGPGSHALILSDQAAPLAGLAPGQYTLAVEVAREDGGSDLVRLPFDWTGSAVDTTARGGAELCSVRLRITP
ncbi:hypothetical protein BFP70_09130 [Thioclava sp. SK-1]|uniref:DUF2271 domain-containing protein n=1 Tax=Thioclava sp. SK-1 TaxID=1889770 RepID=UPI000824AE76|nr:DUF2271 domain-containing protein [Thioclava sp. SK-1]OCX65638.1 hypothetical protein BFP70_09130 [Thioclava sp. SK-1]